VTFTTPLRVLVLCTGNSARSQMAEALMRHLSGGRIDVHSAGTKPQPAIHPMAIDTMRRKFGLTLDGQFSKRLDRYIGEHFDYVITVCDNAAETCPVFPGDPNRIHWSFPDPAAVEGSAEDRQRAFDRIATDIAGRLRVWLLLPDVAERLK
jgi:arsenate reductase